MRRVQRISAALALVLVLVMSSACMGLYSPSAYQGGAAGAAVGATAGALLDGQNAWRGGVIGGVLGAILGASLGEISDQAAREAAQRQQQVAYYNQASNTRVVVVPAPQQGPAAYYGYADPNCPSCGQGYQPPCRMVTQQVWRNGVLVQTIRRQICQ